MSKGLFKDFNPVSETQWKQKIQMDLKGADYNETLLTATREGIDIKPFYHRENAPKVHIPNRSTQTNDWYISQRVYAGNAVAANKKAHDILNRGGEGVIFTIPNKDIDPAALLKGLPKVGIQIHPQFFDLDYIKSIHEIEPKAYVHIDIIHQLFSDGNWFHNKDQDHKNLDSFINDFQGYFSNITVNTSIYKEAGATITQELAYFTAHLNEYLNHLNDSGTLSAFAKAETKHSSLQEPATDVSSSDSRERLQNEKARITKRINIDTTIGSNYFFEIAKYRAYRILTKTLGEIYDLDLGCYITATPSLRNKSLMDYNVNMLRTTTECMSAILGGADTLCNIPYDTFFSKENEFGDRIARNQLRILKDEAYLNKVGNAADGSYYIDSITQQLVEKALEIFKDIENAGGFVQSLFDGTIQRKIKESAQQEQEDFNSGKRVLIGANKHVNADLPLQKEYEILPFVKVNPRKTLVQPIVARRITEDLEKSEIAKL
ncbi:methylmalonyl-CoA mutase [Nonlabens dokdonensis]|jgi:methylmalonyl-CoA mutase|uniref:Methylmalonyl-CoA mutase n=2 Tax=Nonlabens dokdonensis TaxID=328515 RepID=A0ABX5PVQ6_9FLAO|nr:methylmalonyl-CoA mutase subunit beta [Nonlabens dokdonensis]AGC78482.1 putative methylmalonyl-CoA mutase small subunit (MCM-beta) [Nonlabens dokdonensis DSW-6]PZX38226.1 methylmalonyl-CoA mutase [Nonlabens dokdonensis]